MSPAMPEIEVEKLHWENLLVLYDVVLDIEKAGQLSDRATIPILPQIIRFAELMPADSIGMRDKYCESRAQALSFLQRMGILRELKPIEGGWGHRWQSQIEVEPDPSKFPTFYAAVQKEYVRRIGSDQTAKPTANSSSSGTHVFVVHGRDLRLRDGMFTFLRSIGLDPIEWTEAVAMTGKAAPYIGEILAAAFSNAQAVVVMLTGDDEARLRAELHGQSEPSHETELTAQARPNVLFEAGMAMAHNPERTVLVEFGHLRPFSDVVGRHSVKMDGSTEKRQDLANRLVKAGCMARLTGTDWHRSGDLRPVPPNKPRSQEKNRW